MTGYLLTAFLLNMFRLTQSILESLAINNFLHVVLSVLHFIVSFLQCIPGIENYFTDRLIEITVLLERGRSLP